MFALVAFSLLLFGSAQAQYEYATACIPENFYSNRCRLTLLSPSSVSVTIRTATGVDNVNLLPNTPYHQEFDSSFAPTTNGISNKAIRISSAVELQVLMHKSTPEEFAQDVVMVPNQMLSDGTYYTTAYVAPDGGSHCTTSANLRLKQFYLVSSFYDFTLISVRQQDGTWYDVDLRQYGTFFQSTDDVLNHLALGTVISSSQPITVISGNICVSNGPDGWADTYASTIPASQYLGTEYAIPPILNDGFIRYGFSVSVTATADFTQVSSDFGQVTLQDGETRILEFIDMAQSTIVTCSQPCLVSQFSRDYVTQNAAFMQTILSTAQMYTSATFTTLDTTPTSYVNLVIQGELAGSDLFHNGISLSHLTWTMIGGYATAGMSVTQGIHVLESRQNRPFAAYVYNHVKKGSAGSAYALLPTDATAIPPPTTPPPTTPPPTTTTTTTPPPTTPPPTPPPSSLPQHIARVNGTAYTSNGASISAFCRDAHAANIDQKTKDMITTVNQNIGIFMCIQTPGIQVVDGAAALIAQNNMAQMTIRHLLSAQGEHRVADLESCAEDVMNYLSNHANWEQPLFPAVSGCSSLDPNPTFPPAGTLWACDGLNKYGPFIKAANSLSYESKVSEILSTSDGSNLDAGCTQSYSQAAASKTSMMRTEITRALDRVGCTGSVTSLTSSESLNAMGNQAYFSATFLYFPTSTITFDDFLFCMGEMHSFSLLHDNWNPGIVPGAPFFPVAAGCPGLIPSLPGLDDEGERWLCL